jgi:hypothetical protein
VTPTIILKINKKFLVIVVILNASIFYIYLLFPFRCVALRVINVQTEMSRKIL